MSPVQLSAFAVLGIALVVIHSAAPARAEPYFPTADGTTWEYARKGIEPATLTRRIAGTEQIGERELLKVETIVGEEVTTTELVSVDDKGLLLHRRIGRDGEAVSFDPPQTLIPLSLRAGLKWELDDEVAGSEMRQQFVVLGEEDVVVPAGTFRAFRVRCEQPWPISITIERWFVLGTGFVKDITTTRGPTGRLLSRVATVLNKLSVSAPAPPTPTPLPTPTPTAPTSASPLATATPTPGEKTASSLIETPTAPPVRDLVLSAPTTQITLQVAKDRDGEPQSAFAADVPNIFVRWNGENLPVGSFVRVAWIAEDVGDIVAPNFVIDETETEVTTATFGARFTLSRPKDGWAAGKYRLELYLDDHLTATARVTIRD